MLFRDRSDFSLCQVAQTAVWQSSSKGLTVSTAQGHKALRFACRYGSSNTPELLFGDPRAADFVAVHVPVAVDGVTVRLVGTREGDHRPRGPELLFGDPRAADLVAVHVPVAVDGVTVRLVGTREGDVVPS